MSSRLSMETHERARARVLDALRENPFNQQDPGFPHRQVIPFASYAPWAGAPEFQAVLAQVCNNTLVDLYRCWELWTLSQDLAPVEGDVLEVGVWKGGTGALLCAAAARNPATRVFLADTFSGVVKASANDPMYKGGEHSDTSEGLVVDLLRTMGLDNFRILKGIFPDDLPPGPITERIKLCHVDVDTYESARGVVEYAWQRMVPGGVVVFDDYGFWGCEGVTRFVNTLNLPDSRRIHNLNGHALLVRV